MVHELDPRKPPQTIARSKKFSENLFYLASRSWLLVWCGAIWSNCRYETSRRDQKLDKTSNVNQIRRLSLYHNSEKTDSTTEDNQLDWGYLGPAPDKNTIPVTGIQAPIHLKKTITLLFVTTPWEIEFFERLSSNDLGIKENYAAT